MTQRPTEMAAATAIKRVSEIVSQMAGIQLGDKQSTMVENRLRSRMMKLGLARFEEYLEYLGRNQESESLALLSLLTTHHTFFFREFAHFEFLLNVALPQLIVVARARPDKTIRVWSAACSRGQEVYSLAMFFLFHLKSAAPDLKVRVAGTDIDPESVTIATNGVYRSDELKSAPAMYVKDRWVRGKGKVEGFAKATSDLRGACEFAPANLLNIDAFLGTRSFDVIFCRNVFIYFNEAQVKAISNRLLGALEPAGYLVLGLCEGLNGQNLPVTQVAPSVYCKPSARPAAAAPAAPVAPAAPLRVLCVDDSPTIHAMLGKILVPEHGFQVAAKAKDGAEALRILKTQKFDAITLDLHMPEVDGISFLEAYKDRSAPILVISAVNREEPSIGRRALELGAFDYVEKPSLTNMAQAGNEIRSKLKVALAAKRPAKPVSAGGTPLLAAHAPAAAVVALPPRAPAIPAAAAARAAAAPKAAKAAAPEVARPVSAASRLAPSAEPSRLAASPTGKKIRVLIVDDSRTIRSLLRQILQKDGGFEVVGEADRVKRAEELIAELRPDLMTLDIHLPEMDGSDWLKQLKPPISVPTVMITSVSTEESNQVLEALEHGAVDYIQKPSISDLTEIGSSICERLKNAARARVKRRVSGRKASMLSGQPSLDSLIVLGASTGGTEALRVVLESLPPEIPPILIVQHIPAGFSRAFADRLNKLCQFEVKEAASGDEVLRNRVLVAPGGQQMAYRVAGGKRFVEVNDDAPVNRHRPSVDYLFRTVAEIGGRGVVAGILTGMGADGAAQMKALRAGGARTLAQDEASSVVFGMPRAAIEQGAAEVVAPLESFAGEMLALVQSGGAGAGKKTG